MAQIMALCGPFMPEGQFMPQAIHSSAHGKLMNCALPGT